MHVDLLRSAAVFLALLFSLLLTFIVIAANFIASNITADDDVVEHLSVAKENQQERNRMKLLVISACALAKHVLVPLLRKVDHIAHNHDGNE